MKLVKWTAIAKKTLSLDHIARRDSTQQNICDRDFTTTYIYTQRRNTDKLGSSRSLRRLHATWMAYK